MKIKTSTILKYVAAIIILAGLGALGWWTQLNILLQLGAFLYSMVGFGVVILVLRIRIKERLKYIGSIAAMTGFGCATWYAEETISPQLGIFFGFILGYVIAVFVLFGVLGRYGG